MSITVDVREAFASEDCRSALRLLQDPSNSDSLNNESMELISELFKTLLTELSQSSSSPDKAADLKTSTCIECLQVTVDAAKPREAFLALLGETDRFLPSNAITPILSLFTRCLPRLETASPKTASSLKAAVSSQSSSIQKILPDIEQVRSL